MQNFSLIFYYHIFTVTPPWFPHHSLYYFLMIINGTVGDIAEASIVVVNYIIQWLSILYTPK